MKIIYSSHVDLMTYESKLNLSFKRKRKDFQSLLKALDEGKTLIDIFKYKPVAKKIEKRLSKESLIDDSKKLTQIGRNFIKSPYMQELETGIYNMSKVKMDLTAKNISFYNKIERKITNIHKNITPFELDASITGNQFVINGAEKVYFESATFNGQLKGGYNLGEESGQISINLIEGKYKVNGDNWLEMGDMLKKEMIEEVNKLLQDNPYGRFDLNQNLLYITSLKNLSEKEQVEGTLNYFKKDNIELMDFPIMIDDADTAKSYAYLYMYYQLKEDKIYSFKEMDEVFQNEVLSREIFSLEVKQSESILNFQYDQKGFKQYLNKNQYKELAYKLNVIETFLNISVIDNEFSSAKNYGEIVNIFNNNLSSKNVEHVYMVLGYPFAKNRKTKTLEMVNAFKRTYRNITIVEKGNTYHRDHDLEELVKDEVAHIISIDRLHEKYHDRFIIFELKNGSFEVYLVTCEIGQYFNINTNESMGSIFKINRNEISKDNTNLISIIKGALK